MKNSEIFLEELNSIEVKIGKGGSKADVVAFAKTIIQALKAREDAGGNDQLIIEKDQRISELQSELLTAQEAATTAIQMANAAPGQIIKSNEIEIDGQTFKINHGVNLEGKDFTAEQLAADESVVRTLIEMGSGSISLKEEN